MRLTTIMDFIRSFGTHYMYKAIFGAKVNFNSAISQELRKKIRSYLDFLRI